jgi:hypothetical protein
MLLPPADPAILDSYDDLSKPMSTYELLQWLGLGAGGLLVLAIVIGAVKLSRATDAIWPNAATKYGLTFEQQKAGNALTAQRSLLSLTGTVHQVPLRVVSTRELVGQTKRTSTAFYARSLYPAPHRFSLRIRRGSTGHPHHVVTIGDHAFDRAVRLESDSPELTRALANPTVRGAILALPMNDVGLSYDNGELCLSYGQQPFRQAEIDAPLDLVLTLAHSRFA